MKYLEKRPMIMIVVGVIGISLSSIFVRYSTAPSAVTAAYRLLWTVLLMSPTALIRRETRNEIFRMRPRSLALSAISGFFLAMHFWLWFESLAHTSVASSTTIVCTEVIWVSLGFCLFMKGRISWKAVAAIAVTFAGSVLVAFADRESGGSKLYGDILALAAAVAVAVYTLLGRAVRSTASTTAYTYVVYTVCAAVLLVVCACQKLPLAGYGVSGPVVGMLLAVFSTILGHSIFSWCLRFFSPAFVSASKLCEPVAAALMAGILFAEKPVLMQLIGGVLIIGGVMYYSRLEMKKV